MSLDLKTIPAIGSNKKVLTSPISSPVQLRSRGLPTLQCEVVQEWTGIFQVIKGYRNIIWCRTQQSEVHN